MVDANAMGGFLVINPRSGQGLNAGELRREAERLGIEARVLAPGEDPGEVAREARAGPLGGAGGDGSLAAVAEVAVERAWPFVVVPFGTRNHFVRDLGLDRDDPFAALRAFGGQEARIDIGARERPALPQQRLARPLRAARARAGRRRHARAVEGARAPPAEPERPGRDRRRSKRPRPSRSSSRTTATASTSSPSASGSGSTRAHCTCTSHTAGCPEPGRSARHGVHGRRPSGMAARCDRRRAGTARDTAALRDRAGRATSASARARLAPLAYAGTRGRRPRSPRARTSGTRRRRRAARARPRRCGPSSRS